MSTSRTVHTAGAVTTSNALPGYPSQVVGDPPQWDDNSDGTYAVIVGVYQNDVGVAGRAEADLVTPVDLGFNAAGASVVARVRLSQAEGKPLPRIAVYEVGAAQSEPFLQGGNSGISPAGASWVDIPLGSVGSNGLEQFLDRATRGLPLFVQVLTANQFGPYGGSIQGFAWVIYELSLVVTVPGGVAPPRRLWPRDDARGIGGNRIWPPPETRQASNRIDAEI